MYFLRSQVDKMEKRTKKVVKHRDTRVIWETVKAKWEVEEKWRVAV